MAYSTEIYLQQDIVRYLYLIEKGFNGVLEIDIIPNLIDHMAEATMYIRIRKSQDASEIGYKKTQPDLIVLTNRGNFAIECKKDYAHVYGKRGKLLSSCKAQFERLESLKNKKGFVDAFFGYDIFQVKEIIDKILNVPAFPFNPNYR